MSTETGHGSSRSIGARRATPTGDAPRGLRVTLLGTGTALPDPQRVATGLFIEHHGGSWWVDGGPGTLHAAARAGLDPLSVEGVVLSHHHPDHCAELVPLLFAMRVAGRAAPLRVLAGPGFAERFSHLRAAWGRWIEPPGGIVLEQLHGHDHRALGGLQLTTAPAQHGAGALHLAFDADGARLVFSGDTGPSTALEELARGADLLVAECGYVPGAPEPREHLGADDLIALLRRARPRRARITHFYDHPSLGAVVDPRAIMRRLQRALPGIEVRRARDRERLDLPPT